MEKLDQTYMAKSKTKSELIEDLAELVRLKASKCTVKQLRVLLTSYK